MLVYIPFLMWSSYERMDVSMVTLPSSDIVVKKSIAQRVRPSSLAKLSKSSNDQGFYPYLVTNNAYLSTISYADTSIEYIGKTIESFKLADVFWLEASILAHCHNSKKASSVSEKVQRLAFHRPTASYLLGYSQETYSESRSVYDVFLPFRYFRFQYVAKVIAAGRHPNEFLDKVYQRFTNVQTINLKWVLSFDVFEPLQCDERERFSSMMLICAVARILPGEPSLSVTKIELDRDVVSYLIVETPDRLLLVEKNVCVERSSELQQEKSVKAGYTGPIANKFREIWSRRPFHYSGAINMDLAFTAVDILSDLLQRNTTRIGEPNHMLIESDCEEIDSSVRTIKILDPRCGSGTFLALAVIALSNLGNIEITGVDSNVKCARGTVENLMNVLSQNKHTLNCNDSGRNWTLSTAACKATIYNDDSVTLLNKDLKENFDCAIANLPWNRNTYEFHGSDVLNQEDSYSINEGILRGMAQLLKPLAPLLVVSAGNNTDANLRHSYGDPVYFNVRNSLETLGFEILGEASVPPVGFVLPTSKKTPKQSHFNGNKKASTSNNIVVVVALAPNKNS